MYKLLLLIYPLTLLLACASPQVSEPSKNWASVNKLGNNIIPIPLEKIYYYSALEIDLSLKDMLNRWALDTGIQSDYNCRNDFTIPYNLLKTNTLHIKSALTEVESVYENEKIKIIFNFNKTIISTTCGNNTVNDVASYKNINFESGGKNASLMRSPSDKNYDESTNNSISSPKSDNLNALDSSVTSSIDLLNKLESSLNQANKVINDNSLQTDIFPSIINYKDTNDQSINKSIVSAGDSIIKLSTTTQLYNATVMQSKTDCEDYLKELNLMISNPSINRKKLIQISKNNSMNQICIKK